jgi:hypothetical protein
VSFVFGVIKKTVKSVSVEIKAPLKTPVFARSARVQSPPARLNDEVGQGQPFGRGLR